MRTILYEVVDGERYVAGQGEFQHAKEYVRTLRSKLRGDDRAIATKKIAACNKALNLPHTDGIRD